MKNLLTKQEQKDDFDRLANDCRNWFAKARTLQYSASELWKIYQHANQEVRKSEKGICPIALSILDQVLLLEGFAVECALKGLYAANKGKIAEGGRIKLGGSHNLVQLSRKADVELSTRESSIFKLLSLIITSYGRYPAPMRFEANPRTRTKEHGFSPLYRWDWGDLVLVDNFIFSIIGEPIDERPLGLI